MCPSQLVDAIINSSPREDSTRIGSGGVVRRQAVDVSPMRRVNQAIYLITQGARAAAFRNVKTIAECLVSFPLVSFEPQLFVLICIPQRLL